MKILHILAFSLLASLLSTAAPSPLTPLPREQPQWWRKQYEQQVEQIKNNPCGVLFLGDSITDYWKREGKPIWEKAFSPYHPCNFGISGDQTTNLIYRITDSGPDGPQTLHRHDRHQQYRSFQRRGSPGKNGHGNSGCR